MGDFSWEELVPPLLIATALVFIWIAFLHWVHVARLTALVRRFTRCPCCKESKWCADSCTFAEDAPAAHAKMIEAREVLRDV